MEILLTKEEEKVVLDYNKSLITTDNKALSMFKMVGNVYERNKSAGKTKDIKKAICKTIGNIFGNVEQDNTNIAYLKKCVTIAIDFKCFNFEYQDEKGIDKLTYKTIENITKLLYFAQENEKEIKDDFKTIRAEIDDELSCDFLTKNNYNNIINQKVKDIKHRNSINGNEDDLTLGVDGVIKGVNKITTEEDFQKVLDALLQKGKDLGVTK